MENKSAVVYISSYRSFVWHQGNGKTGIGIWFGDDNRLNTSQLASDSGQTNKKALIQAAYTAITVAADSGIEELEVRTTDHYLISIMLKWLNKWKSKGWKKANGEPPKHLEEIQKLDRAVSTRMKTVQWTQVKYANHKGCSLAKELAIKGSKMVFCNKDSLNLNELKKALAELDDDKE